MKKIFLKKHNNLLLLIVISCLTIVMTSAISFTVYADDDDDGCSIVTPGVGSSGYADDKAIVNYDTQNGVDKEYMEQSHYFSLDLTGNDDSTTTYHLFTNEKDLEESVNNGLCQNVTCSLGSDMGFTGDLNDWGNQLKDSGNQYGSNGQSFDFTNNSIGASMARENLIKNYGYDADEISKMSDSDIADIATEIAKTDGSFMSSKAHWGTTIYGQYVGFLACDGDLSAACQKAGNYWFITGIKKDAQKGEAGTDDYGQLCTGPECPEPWVPEDNPPQVTKYELNLDSCSINIPEVPKVESKPIPYRAPTGGSCGTTTTRTTYSTRSVACNKVMMLSTTTTTAQLPASPGRVYAGSGFNWGSVTSVTNYSETVWDTSQLEYERNVAKTQMESIKSAIKCEQENLKKLEKQFIPQINSCSSQVETLRRSLNACNSSPCEWESDPKPDDPEHKVCRYPDCSGISSSLSSQKSECTRLEKQYETLKGTIEKEIEGFEEDLKLAELKLKELEDCAAEIPQGTSYSTTGTVHIENQMMTLKEKNGNIYTQTINFIKGISKNNGFPLTKAEIDKLDNQSYLKINTEFFVPYYVKQGTQGTLTASITGAINIPNYECLINTTNYILCTGNDCEGELEIIYRPISLVDPFPNIKGNSSSRPMGSNWSESYAKTVIKNNRSVSDYDVYNLTPVYTITLTPTTISEIRKYNDNHEMNDFNMKCVSGYKCISSFIWDEFPSIVNTVKSCATSTGWDQSCYYGGVSE